MAKSTQEASSPWKHPGFNSSSIQHDPIDPVTFNLTPSDFCRAPRSQAEVSVPNYSGVNDEAPRDDHTKPAFIGRYLLE